MYSELPSNTSSLSLGPFWDKKDNDLEEVQNTIDDHTDDITELK